MDAFVPVRFTPMLSYVGLDGASSVPACMNIRCDMKMCGSIKSYVQIKVTTRL